MTEAEQIKQLYEDMYTAMVKKDRPELERVFADDFVLVHMTGMRQNKQEHIDSIMDGTLNYFSAETYRSDVTLNPDGLTGHIDGKSKVLAAVFGGGKHTWRLNLNIDVRKENGRWRAVYSKASTY